MKKLYIHIGLPKTGTTIIQSILKDKIKELRKENITYVDFYDFLTAIRMGSIPDCKEFFINLNKQIPDNQSLLISSEFLVGMAAYPKMHFLSVDSISQMLHQTTSMFDVYIIIYLRRIDLWLESMYTQTVSDGATLSFDDYVNQNNIYVLDFYKLILSYSDRFGKDKTIVRLYDKKYLPEQHSLTQDFGKIINSKILRDANVAEFSNTNTNTGYDSVSVEIARLCNAYADVGQKKEIRRILQYAINKKLFCRNVYFTMEERNKLLDSHAKAEEKIKKEFFPDLNGDLFSPVEYLEPESNALKLEDAVRTLMFAIMAPSPYEHILTLRSLHVLYKIEIFLKRFSVIKSLGKKILRAFGIRDKQ